MKLVKKITPVLFAIALGLTGFVGWRYNQLKYAVSDEPAQPDGLAERDQTKKQPVADLTESGAYFAVADWNIRFPLPTELRGDLLSHESNGDASGSIIFASKRLNGLTGDSSCDLTKQPDGGYSGGIQASLVRIDPRSYPADSLALYKKQLTHIKDLSGYEYYARKQTRDPPVTCLTGIHEEHETVEQSITDQLNDAFGRIESIN